MTSSSSDGTGALHTGDPGPLVRMSGLRKVFYTDEIETHALSDIHLEIRDGEYLAIAGPSGCGKSTLLSILGLLDTPSGGEFSLYGQGIERLAASERGDLRAKPVLAS